MRVPPDGGVVGGAGARGRHRRCDQVGSARSDAASSGTTVSRAKRGEDAGDQRAEQAHRHPAGLELGPAPAVEAQLEAEAVEARGERHAVAEVVGEHVGRAPAPDRRAGSARRAARRRGAGPRRRPRRRPPQRGADRVRRPCAATSGWATGSDQPGLRAEQQQVDGVGQRLGDLPLLAPRLLPHAIASRDAGPRHRRWDAAASGGATRQATSARRARPWRRAAPALPARIASVPGIGSASRPAAAAGARTADARRPRRRPPQRRRVRTAARCSCRARDDPRHPQRARGLEAEPGRPGTAGPTGVVTRKRTTPGSIVDTRAVKASGASARTPAEARAWVASACTSACSSCRSRRVAATRSIARATSPPASTPSARAAAASRTAGEDAGRAGPASIAAAIGAPCWISAAVTRSSAPSGSGATVASATKAVVGALPARSGEARRSSAAGELRVAAIEQAPLAGRGRRAGARSPPRPATTTAATGPATSADHDDRAGADHRRCRPRARAAVGPIPAAASSCSNQAGAAGGVLARRAGVASERRGPRRGLRRAGPRARPPARRCPTNAMVAVIGTTRGRARARRRRGSAARAARAARRARRGAAPDRPPPAGRPPRRPPRPGARRRRAGRPAR